MAGAAKHVTTAHAFAEESDVGTGTSASGVAVDSHGGLTSGALTLAVVTSSHCLAEGNVVFEGKARLQVTAPVIVENVHFHLAGSSSGNEEGSND